MRQTKLTITLLFLVLTVRAWAQNAVAIYQTDGNVTKFAFTEKPVVTYSNNELVLTTSSTSVQYPIYLLKKLAFEIEWDVETAIEEVKAAMQGMLSPEIKEEVTATLEVLQTFHISKVGTIAGCVVREGKIKRSNKVRVIRDGIVIFTGDLASLKHGKDDVKEMGVNQECGVSIRSYNDLVEGDLLESFEQIEVAKTL